MPEANADAGAMTLPPDHPEPFAALLGRMLYPGPTEREQRRAETYASQYLTEPLRQFYACGGTLSQEALLRIATGAPEILDDLEDRWWAGQATGEVTKILIALFISDRKLATWKNATRIVEAETGTEPGTSRSTLMEYRRQFRPVAHLWAAWQIREGVFTADNPDADSLPADVCKFVGMAERIRQWGQKFTPDRAKAKPLFGEDMLVAPDFWLEQQNIANWPPEGTLPMVTALSKHLEMLNPAGRPKRKKNR